MVRRGEGGGRSVLALGGAEVWRSTLLSGPCSWLILSRGFILAESLRQ